MTDVRQRLRDAIAAVDAAGVLDESEPMEAVLALAREVAAEHDYAAEHEQRLRTPRPRERGDDGTWTTTSPRRSTATRHRLLPGAETIAFEFRHDGIDDVQAFEASALFRAAAAWCEDHPDATILGVALDQSGDSARMSLWLTVEDADGP